MRPVRQEIMWQAVLDAVEALERSGPLDVLDVGGGTGGDAVRLAALGHRVTVVDPSPDALASLRTIPRLDVKPIASSCCGMAGPFGYMAETQEVSRAMAEASLLPAIRAAGDSEA